MNDIYEYKKEKSTKERTAKYVFLNVEYSSELYDKAKHLLDNEYLVTDDLSSQHRLSVWYDVAVRRLLTNDFKWN